MASGSDIVSPAGARDKKNAIHGEYGPFDFFDVLDMLGQEGIGMDDGGYLTGDEPKLKAKAAAVVKKHPVGCRQRNVVRPFLRVNTELDEDLGPELLKYGAILKEAVDKMHAEAEAERLEYLKNAR